MFNVKAPSIEWIRNSSRALFDENKEPKLLDIRPQLLRDMTNEAPTTKAYNTYFYEFARWFLPDFIVETGTDRGRSAAHFAAGNPDAQVLTIDIDAACSQHARELGLDNIRAITADSLEYVPHIDNESIDVLFLDSLHTYEHTQAEFVAFFPKVAPGGVIFIDDIHLDEGMNRFWEWLTRCAHDYGDVADISELHFSGFGVVVKKRK